MTRPYDWQRDGAFERDFPPIVGTGRGEVLNRPQIEWRTAEVDPDVLVSGATYHYAISPTGMLFECPTTSAPPSGPPWFKWGTVPEVDEIDDETLLEGFAGYFSTPVPPNPRRPRGGPSAP